MKITIDSLKSATKVALLPHINPDWDAIGSCFALYEALKSMGKNCSVLVDEPLDYRFDFKNLNCEVYDENKEYNFDLVCAVDTATMERLGKRKALFEKQKNTLLIDHHISGDNYAAHSLVYGNKCASAEIVYEILKEMECPITKTIAEYLFCGISTDSGSFQYNSVTEETFNIAGKLRKIGIDTAYLSTMLYQNEPYKKILLRSVAAKNIEFISCGKGAITHLSQNDFKSCDADMSLSEDLADFPRKVSGVEVSVLLREVSFDEVRMSFRSKNTDITPIANHFGGGGHKLASGATYHGSLNDAIKEVKTELEKILK